MNRLLLTLVLVPSIIMSSCTQAPAQRKLLILGSSTPSCTFGISYPDSCYVYRLQKYYRDHGFPISVDNRAIAGEDVYRGMPTSYAPPPNRRAPHPTANITEGLKGNPDVVLINYPSNGYDSFTVREVMFCLRTIKQVANAAGKPCYVTTTQPRSTPQLFRTSAVRKVMAEIKDSVLTEFGQYSINFWDGLVNPVDSSILLQYNTNFNAVDSTHPNDAGHALLFQQVLAKNIFNVALPVRLLSFTSKAVTGATELTWTVDGENGIRSYQLEKSFDGRRFEKIYEANALNSDKPHSYTFLDPADPGMASFYRLAIAGTSNFINYSDIIAVKASTDVIEKLYLPDASTMITKFNSSKKRELTLAIFNATGQLLIETRRTVQPGSNNLSVAVASLQKGVYFLRVYGEGLEKMTKSFSKR